MEFLFELAPDECLWPLLSRFSSDAMGDSLVVVHHHDNFDDDCDHELDACGNEGTFIHSSIRMD